MKPVLIFPLIALLASPISAQQETPAPETQTIQMECHDLAVGKYIVSGETLINGRACHPVSTAQKASDGPGSAKASADPNTASTRVPTAVIPAIVLEDGTPVHLVLDENLSSATATTGQTVEFEVVDDIVVNGLVVIPRSSTAWATVTEAEHKRHLGRPGKLDLNIDKVRLADGEKVLLRAVKDVQGGGHTGAMTGAIVATSLIVWPAAPFFLFMHGKDITIPKGTQITAFVQGDVRLQADKFQKELAVAK
jgi:hypothetical protein